MSANRCGAVTLVGPPAHRRESKSLLFASFPSSDNLQDYKTEQAGVRAETHRTYTLRSVGTAVTPFRSCKPEPSFLLRQALPVLGKETTLSRPGAKAKGSGNKQASPLTILSAAYKPHRALLLLDAHTQGGTCTFCWVIGFVARYFSDIAESSEREEALSRLHRTHTMGLSDGTPCTPKLQRKLGVVVTMC